MKIKMISFGTPEYKEMVKLRDDVLRKPLGIQFDPGQLAKEDTDLLIGCYDDSDTLRGCVILTPLTEEIVKLRQMAVSPDFQKQGIGEKLIHFTEALCLEKGYNRIELHARKYAMGFYEKFDYNKKGEEFMEVGIPHYRMIKILS